MYSELSDLLLSCVPMMLTAGLTFPVRCDGERRGCLRHVDDTADENQ